LRMTQRRKGDEGAKAAIGYCCEDISQPWRLDLLRAFA